MTCDATREQLLVLPVDALDLPHLASCPACAAVADAIRATHAAAQDELATFAAAGDLDAALAAALGDSTDAEVVPLRTWRATMSTAVPSVLLATAAAAALWVALAPPAPPPDGAVAVRPDPEVEEPERAAMDAAPAAVAPRGAGTTPDPTAPTASSAVPAASVAAAPSVPSAAPPEAPPPPVATAPRPPARPSAATRPAAAAPRPPARPTTPAPPVAAPPVPASSVPAPETPAPVAPAPAPAPPAPTAPAPVAPHAASIVPQPTSPPEPDPPDDDCTHLVRLEPLAMLGKLKPGQIAACEAVLAGANRTLADKVSRLLLADAWSKGDKARWEELVDRHLREVDRSDPDLSYKFALHLSKQAGEEERVLRWSERALENRNEWTGQTYTRRLSGLYKIRAVAAHSLWRAAEAAGTDASAARERTAVLAREWADWLTAAGVDAAPARELCLAAAGDRARCEP